VTSAPSTIHGSVPINKTADLKGVKIRTAQRLQRDLLTALGATPVGMSISKIPESISRGVIDATPMHYAALHAFGIASATKYHYENKLGLMPFGWVMMKDEFAKLPADVQKIMLEYGGENASRMFGQAMDSECERLRKQTLTSKDEVVVTPSKADIENWDAALKPVVDKWIEDHSKGKMLYDALVNELKILRGN
jgi:TRAP-type C4-dicarboxylate transport system substrate-binding protein